jgi:hypothetical protein
MQAQEFAALERQAAFENRLLDKVENEQQLFQGEVVFQKQQVSALCADVARMSS